MWGKLKYMSKYHHPCKYNKLKCEFLFEHYDIFNIINQSCKVRANFLLTGMEVYSTMKHLIDMYDLNSHF